MTEQLWNRIAKHQHQYPSQRDWFPFLKCWFYLDVFLGCTSAPQNRSFLTQLCRIGVFSDDSGLLVHLCLDGWCIFSIKAYPASSLQQESGFRLIIYSAISGCCENGVESSQVFALLGPKLEKEDKIDETKWKPKWRIGRSNSMGVKHIFKSNYKKHKRVLRSKSKQLLC